MQFGEKLQMLRKNKGYSQEELADLLGVTRQSVSKWESGSTYPEMDKLLSLCKIFNVSLNDLTNEEVKKEMLQMRDKNSFKKFVFAVLEMINKSMQMIKKMTSKERVKMISELLLLFVLLLIFKVPFNIVNNSIRDVFINMGDAFELLNSIWLFISNFIYLILFIVVFFYIYKVRYLDKFDKKKEEISEVEEKENSACETSNNSLNRSSNVIFDFLSALFNVGVKCFLLLLILPLVITFLVLSILMVISFIYGVIVGYLGIFIGLLGATIGAILVLEIFFRLLFSQKINFKRSFIMFIASIIVMAVGSGVFMLEVMNTKYVNGVPEGVQISEKEKSFDMSDDLVIMDPFYDVKYEVNENVNDVKISVTYYEEYNDAEFENNQGVINIYNNQNITNIKNFGNLLKKDLKKKNVYNYGKLWSISVKVISNKENIDKLKNNYESYMTTDKENYSDYENELSKLELENARWEAKYDNLEEKYEALEEKLELIKGEINN